MDGRKPIHIFLNLVCTKAVSTFIEKWCHKLCYVIFSTIKDKKKDYDAKLIFWSFGTIFWLNHFLSGAKQRLCFSKIIKIDNQRGTPYLTIVHIMANGNFISQISILLSKLLLSITVQINCLRDLFFANSHLTALNLKKVVSITCFSLSR